MTRSEFGNRAHESAVCPGPTVGRDHARAPKSHTDRHQGAAKFANHLADASPQKAVDTAKDCSQSLDPTPEAKDPTHHEAPARDHVPIPDKIHHEAPDTDQTAPAREKEEAEAEEDHFPKKLKSSAESTTSV